MKTHTTWTARCLFLAISIGASCALADDKLPEGTSAKIAELEATRQSEYTKALELIDDLNNKYLEALIMAKDAAQKAGKLERLLAADAEIKQVKSGKAAGEMPEDEDIARLRKAYTKTLLARQDAVAARRTEADRKYAAGIQLLVENLTKEGKIEEAMRVREFKKGMSKPVAQNTEERPEPPVTPSKPTTPAAKPSIIGTTWKVQNPKGTTITLLAEGQIKGKSSGTGLHTYEIIDENRIRISWGKNRGPSQKKDYTIDDKRTLLKGTGDGSVWDRVAAVE